MNEMNPARTASPPDERELLRRAREDGEGAFRALIEPHHASLHAHCYRMLGSVHDADDALQDALLRAWRGLARFEGRSAVRTWLHTIATNACLDLIGRRPKRVLPMDYGPPAAGPDSDSASAPAAVWIEPYPDELLDAGDGAAPEARYEEREAIELAFIAALQHLPARQRAALILRDVLGFRAREVAEALEVSPAAVNSALQRARKSIDERLPARSQQATMRSLGDSRVREIVERFVDAFERGEVGAILELLAEDATFEMPPYTAWSDGRGRVGESWLMPEGPPPRLRYLATGANAQPAAAAYVLRPGSDRYVPLALDALALAEGGISRIVAFRGTDVFERFGLPPALEP